LKTKYAKKVITDWVEVTDPAKHVFEDLGIAAFMIELWSDMYGVEADRADQNGSESNENQKFPGFVDVGCGNGLLVHILVSEGYEGWGFDARRRKSWAIFPANVQAKLKELILVPEIYRKSSSADNLDSQNTNGIDGYHNGSFPNGTFIISNHADELTPWTPLLAYLSNCPFIAIPCCSHNLTGARCRFYVHSTQNENTGSAQKEKAKEPMEVANSTEAALINTTLSKNTTGPGPSTGSLARPKQAQVKAPSAYAGLTAYIAKLTEELGFKTEKEVLRIPSTRNLAVVGRWEIMNNGTREEKTEVVTKIIQREIGDLDKSGREWVEYAEKLRKGKGSGH
jgi:tRNASer (uridine44-2'-O)-methyltransferase